MPDEHTRWQRVSGHAEGKAAFHARQRTDELRRIEVKEEDPVEDEAARDRLLLRWTVLVVLLLVCIGLLVWQVFFT